MKRIDHSYQANPIKSTNIINNSNSGSNAKINKNQHYSIARSVQFVHPVSRQMRNAKIVSSLLVFIPYTTWGYSCLLQHGIFAQFFLSTDPRLEKPRTRDSAEKNKNLPPPCYLWWCIGCLIIRRQVVEGVLWIE